MTEEEHEKAYIALRNRYYKFSSVSGPGVEGFRTLEHFVEYCLKLGYTPNHRLLRKDTALPASPTNLIVLRAKKDPGTGKEIRLNAIHAASWDNAVSRFKAALASASPSRIARTVSDARGGRLWPIVNSIEK